LVWFRIQGLLIDVFFATCHNAPQTIVAKEMFEFGIKDTIDLLAIRQAGCGLLLGSNKHNNGWNNRKTTSWVS
jgi:hypothetical protein